ncbi:MAG: hypothetical protein ACREQK_08075 [Candidatus Binatia bacterium]
MVARNRQARGAWPLSAPRTSPLVRSSTVTSRDGNNFSLRYALSISREEIWKAHEEAKRSLLLKAALNGVPSLSVLDGWWIEGCIKGVTGWSIGPKQREAGEVKNHSGDAASLYDKLEHVILPLFYRDRNGFIDVMRHAIALNGSFFNTHRMLQQYVLKAYF